MFRFFLNQGIASSSDWFRDNLNFLDKAFKLLEVSGFKTDEQMVLCCANKPWQGLIKDFLIHLMHLPPPSVYKGKPAARYFLLSGRQSCSHYDGQRLLKSSDLALNTSCVICLLINNGSNASVQLKDGQLQERSIQSRQRKRTVFNSDGKILAATSSKRLSRFDLK